MAAPLPRVTLQSTGPLVASVATSPSEEVESKSGE